jgi:hypothetical protein
MTPEAVGFGGDQRTGDAARVFLAGAAAYQRSDDQILGVGEREYRHASDSRQQSGGHDQQKNYRCATHGGDMAPA